MTTPVMEFNLYNVFHSGGFFLARPEILQKHELISELPPISTSKSHSAQANHTEIILREQARVQRLQLFLKDLVRQEDVEHYTATVAWRAWRTLSEDLVGTLPVPDVAAGADRQILFSWNSGEHHFELEIYPSGLGEFFYLNYESDATWEEEHTMGEPVSQDVSHFLALFSFYA